LGYHYAYIIQERGSCVKDKTGKMLGSRKKSLQAPAKMAGGLDLAGYPPTLGGFVRASVGVTMVSPMVSVHTEREHLANSDIAI